MRYLIYNLANGDCMLTDRPLAIDFVNAYSRCTVIFDLERQAKHFGGLWSNCEVVFAGSRGKADAIFVEKKLAELEHLPSKVLVKND